MVSFSKVTQKIRSSEIRRLMGLAADPSLISFSGGMPANTLFPIDALDEIYKNLTLASKQAAFQYGPTTGYPPLLNSLKAYLSSKGIPMEGNDLIITTGAQQAINLLTKVFIDPGDIILTEYPSFIGALAAFLSYGARLKDVPLDQDGIRLDDLEKTLQKYAGPRLKMLYVNPCFQNPGGILYSIERKKALLELLKGREISLLEDDPYGELYFDEADKPLTTSLKTLAAGNEPVPICYVGSFAKIFGPGMRLGWLLGPKGIVEKCELAKQSMDACSATFTQVLAHAFLSQNKMPAYLDFVRKAYKRRAKSMLDALEKYMPSRVHWTSPRGGFYVWVTLPRKIDSSEVFAASFKQGAAFVIGNAFDPQAKRNNCLRLAFSHTPEEKIEQGIKIIADAITSLM